MKHSKLTSLFRFVAVGVALIFGTSLWAQTVNIKGVVTEAATGETVIGASISEVGTTNGTITDFDGNFELQVQKGAELEISYVGFKTVKIAATPNMSVALEEDKAILEEVVVIGYGSVKKNDATGSVTAIKPDDMNKGLNTNAQDMLSGKIAGVVVTSDGGIPGGSSTIRIRGGSSLNASNDPLIVIDGMQMDNSGIQGMSNILSMVNPNDIETFTVLKDASATAIYGSRASNGVIIITTKKGSAGSKPKFQYDGNASASVLTKRLDVMNASQYRNFISKYFPAQVNGLGNFDTNWQDEIFRIGINTDHNFSITGGAKNMPYRASIGYTLANGIMEKSQMQRVTAAVSLNPSFLDNHLSFNFNAKGMYVHNIYNDGGGIVGSAISFDPTRPVHSDLPEFGGFYQYNRPTTSDWGDPTWTRLPAQNVGQNPVAQIKNRDDAAHTGVFVGNLEADYKIHGFEDLRLHAGFAADYEYGEETNEYSPYSFGNNYYGSYAFNSAQKYNLQFNAYAQYYKDFNENHHFDAMLGYEWQHYHRTWYGYSYGRYQDTWEKDGLAGQKYNYQDGSVSKSNPHATEYYLVSFFGRFNYTALNRYMVTFSLRADGSSRFAKGKRWGWFPAVALGWKMKEEPWLRDVYWLSELKIRLGYGITGQQEISSSNYPAMVRYTQSTGYAQITLGEKDANGDYIYYDTYRPEAYNKDLTWEKTTTYNAGIDFGFLKGRIAGSIEYYYRKTTDLIAYVHIPSGTNFSNMIDKNIGSLTNQGVEFMLNAVAIDKPTHKSKYKWDMGFNFTWNVNKITSLSDGIDPNYYVETGATSAYGNGTNLQRHKEGYAASTFFLYKTKLNNKGYVVADGNERVAMHKPAPDFTLGFQSKWQFFNFDIGISLRANIGNYVFNNVKAGQVANGSNTVRDGTYTNWLVDAESDFQKVYDPKNTEKPYSIDQSILSLSDMFLEDASFIRCDNITLGYTWTKPSLKARLYGTIQNPFVITGYSGLDPEIAGGVDNNIYPRAMTMLVGLSLTF